MCVNLHTSSNVFLHVFQRLPTSSSSNAAPSFSTAEAEAMAVEGLRRRPAPPGRPQLQSTGVRAKCAKSGSRNESLLWFPQMGGHAALHVIGKCGISVIVKFVSPPPLRRARCVCLLVCARVCLRADLFRICPMCFSPIVASYESSPPIHHVDPLCSCRGSWNEHVNSYNLSENLSAPPSPPLQC